MMKVIQETCCAHELLVFCIFTNTWLAKSSDISELSVLSLKIALTSCNIGVIPVPPAIIPNFLAITVSGVDFLSGLTWNTPIKNEMILIKLKSLQICINIFQYRLNFM